MLKSILACSLFVISIVSCKSQDQIKSANTDTMQLTLLIEDNYSGQDEEEFLTINDQNELEKFFGKVNRTRKPGLPIPEVDFKKEMVIVWCGGNKDSSKLRLSVKNTTDQSIFLKKERMTLSNLKGAVITPFVMYKLPKTQKVVKFQ
ncbi:hypothetical protein [Maribacter sp. MMG018]|uniref:hypothetical protein n=1 Tax=Maribacter sp. MMG018 TaxID=2822688 RepID=UPI001B36C319|nr:hypothetical protein [Maribacter sp. MMG018]